MSAPEAVGTRAGARRDRDAAGGRAELPAQDTQQAAQGGQPTEGVRVKIMKFARALKRKLEAERKEKAELEDSIQKE